MNETGGTQISPRTALLVVCVAQFLGPLMGSAVGIALPAIGYDFSAGAAMLSRVESDYILAFSVMLLPAGRFGDIKGRKKVFFTGLFLFTLVTAALPQAWSIESFIVLRILQGSGAAMITSTSIAILLSVFPPASRGRAMGIVVAAVYVGLSVGPVLGGTIVTYMGWRWVFYGVLPVCVFALWLTATSMRGDWYGDRQETFDWRGALLYMAALCSMVYGVIGAGSGLVGHVLTGGGLAGMVFFVRLQRRAKYPLLDVSLLISNRVFAFSNLATLVNYASSFGVVFLLSLYLQYVRGFTPQGAGMVLILQPLVQAAISPGAGKLSDRFPPSRLATLGIFMCTCGLVCASFISVTTPIFMIGAILVLFGCSYGIFASPNMTAIMNSVTARHYGIASGMVATMRTMGMLVCMTTVTLIFRLYLGDTPVSAESIPDFVKSLQVLFILFSCLSLVGVFLSMVRTSPKVAA